MTPDEIQKLSSDELLNVMRRVGLPVEMSMFATIHFESDERLDGYTEKDLDQISEDLEGGDLARWRRELAEYFASNR